MAFPQLIKLDGKYLTDDGRTFSQPWDRRAVDLELANGGLKRYLKANKNIFNIEWVWLPEESTQTVDKKEARNYILGLKDGGNVVALEVVRDLTSSVSYNVLFDSYSESIPRRDPFTNIIFYDVQIVLKEV